MTGQFTGEYGAIRDFIQQTSIQSSDSNSIPDSLNFEAILPFRSGSTVIGEISYDSNAAFLFALDVGSGIERHFETTGELALEIDGFRFRSSGQRVSLFTTQRNDGSAVFRVAAFLDVVNLPAGFSYSGTTTPVQNIVFQFVDFDGSVFDGSSVPLVPLDVSDLDDVDGIISTQSPIGTPPETWSFDGAGSHVGNFHQIRQGFDSGRVSAVPEPSSVGILMFAAIGTAVIRHNKKRKFLMRAPR